MILIKGTLGYTKCRCPIDRTIQKDYIECKIKDRIQFIYRDSRHKSSPYKCDNLFGFNLSKGLA